MEMLSELCGPVTFIKFKIVKEHKTFESWLMFELSPLRKEEQECNTEDTRKEGI